jgi:surface polysaccharide O-acyltransferase-like enzyme
MLLLNVFGSWWISVSEGAYSSFFMGYKTLNTLVIAVMIFVLAQKYGDQIKGRFRTFVSMVAKYSLGIYLLHPILLIPVRNIDNGYYDFFGTNWVAIPAISFCVMLISLFITMVFAHIPILKRLVP